MNPSDPDTLIFDRDKERWRFPVNRLFFSLHVSAGLSDPHIDAVHIFRPNWLLTPRKAFVWGPRFVGELLSGQAAATLMVETSTAHGASFLRSAVHLSKDDMSLWFPVLAYYRLYGWLAPTDALSSGDARLSEPSFTTPDSCRRTTTQDWSTFTKLGFLLVGRAIFVGPLSFSKAKSITFKSRSNIQKLLLNLFSRPLRYCVCKSVRYLLQPLSTSLNWFSHYQLQTLARRNPSMNSSHQSSQPLGFMFLVYSHTIGMRKEGIMTPDPRNGGYRHFLITLHSSPVITELRHGDSTHCGDNFQLIGASNLNPSKPRYDPLFHSLKSYYSQWCDQDYVLYGIHLRSNSSLLLWLCGNSLRIMILVSCLALFCEPYCWKNYSLWIPMSSCPFFGFGFGLSKVSLHPATTLANFFKLQSTLNLARNIFKLLPFVDLLKPMRSAAMTPFLTPTSLMTVASSSSIDLFMKESFDSLDLTCTKSLQEFGSKLSITHCRLIISLLCTFVVLALGNALLSCNLRNGCLNLTSFE